VKEFNIIKFVGGRIDVELKPFIWNVVTPVKGKLPLTFKVNGDIDAHTPLKFVNCEQLKLETIVKYEGIDTCKYPGA
jgi:hypothetical protein